MSNNEIKLLEFAKISTLEDIEKIKILQDSLINEPSATNKETVKDFQEQYTEAIDKLNKINDNLKNTQKNIANDIKKTNNEIINYKSTLKTNNKLFNKYSDDIQNKMQIVATRDRMLQLSQERNVYKKKIIYVLLSIIIALIIAVIYSYNVFSKPKISNK
jgi:predicted  nucleic acid-binding Zn-ribbon protein